MIANDNPEHVSVTDQANNFQKRNSEAGKISYGIWYEGMPPGLKLAVQLSAAIRQVLTISEQWKLTGGISTETTCILLDAIHFTGNNIGKCNHKRLKDEFARLGISQEGYNVLIITLRAMCLGYQVEHMRALNQYRTEIGGCLPEQNIARGSSD